MEEKISTAEKTTNIIYRVVLGDKVYELPFPIEVTDEELAYASSLCVICLKLIKITVNEIEQLKAELAELRKEKKC